MLAPTLVSPAPQSGPPPAAPALPDATTPGAATGVSPEAAETPGAEATASDTATSAPEVAHPPTTLGATDAFSEFRGRFDAGRYAEAIPYAQRVLELAERHASASEAEEVQVALMNLALTQQLAGEYTAAEANFQRAIELVQASGRPLRARLARAYAGLASSYHGEGRHELAVDSFEQAVALTRRHEGLLTDRQVPLLEKYIDSLTELGRYDEALRGQRYILRVAGRKYGENHVEFASTLERVGRWYTRVGAYDQARRLIKRAIGLVEALEGPRSTRLLSPLASLAACDRKQLLEPVQRDAPDPDSDRGFGDRAVPTTYTPAMLIGEAEKALLRAVSIAEGHPEPSPVQVADVRTQLGDWYQGRGQPERALPHYHAAWAAAARAPETQVQGRTLLEVLFGEPVLLQIVRPEGWNRYAARPPGQVEIRNVELELTVNARGRVETIKVIDDSGDSRRAAKTAEALELTARYRPRMVQGHPVPTERVTFSQPWYVPLPQAPDAAPDGNERTSNGVTSVPAPAQTSPAPTETDADAAAPIARPG